MNAKAFRRFDVIVIGGGAAGLMAAISSASNGADTILIEHTDRVGKKLLSTGNGKCNYTNALQGITYYRGEDPAFVLPVFQQFGLKETLSFFEKAGIYPKCRDGYYYPSSGQASSVLEVLRMETAYQGVALRTECVMERIDRAGKDICLTTNQGRIRGKTVIFATGLLAAKKTGSDGSAFPYIEELGHHFTDIVPALVALKGKQSFFKALAGIRAEILVKLYINNKLTADEYGELQLTDYGISGIPVFQLSRFAAKALQKKLPVYVLLDFMPKFTEEEAKELFFDRFYRNTRGKTAEESLIGLFHKKLGGVLLKEAGILLSVAANQITKEQIKRLVKKTKSLRVDITGTNSFEQAQVCAGGVDTAEINSETLESLLVPNVYFAGEVIDIDGRCGGYNLQWAWSSGYVAGLHAALKALSVRNS